MRNENDQFPAASVYHNKFTQKTVWELVEKAVGKNSPKITTIFSRSGNQEYEAATPIASVEGWRKEPHGILARHSGYGLPPPNVAPLLFLQASHIIHDQAYWSPQQTSDFLQTRKVPIPVNYGSLSLKHLFVLHGATLDAQNQRRPFPGLVIANLHTETYRYEYRFVHTPGRTPHIINEEGSVLEILLLAHTDQLLPSNRRELLQRLLTAISDQNGEMENELNRHLATIAQEEPKRDSMVISRNALKEVNKFLKLTGLYSTLFQTPNFFAEMKSRVSNP